jgi:hypothetical protein
MSSIELLIKKKKSEHLSIPGFEPLPLLPHGARLK